ncbi:MAG: hypothetical protein HZB53_13650 [Chloroflexi bacterium]|nr:hypothetical protein [Chloroflexota bacterium]
MSAALESLAWLVGITLVMLMLKRWIHRHVRGVGLLLTGSNAGSFVLFSALFFPGTVAHELSHLIAARFLDVRVHRISLLPSKQRNGVMSLGFVDVDRTDALREALIGLAPLITGTALTLLIASNNLAPVAGAATQTAELGELMGSIPRLLSSRDLYLWLYLIFTISNGMLPSESDRRAWAPIALWLAAIGLVMYLAGAFSAVPDTFDRDLGSAVRLIVRAFAFAVTVDVLVMPILFVLEQLLQVLTGKRVEY